MCWRIGSKVQGLVGLSFSGFLLGAVRLGQAVLLFNFYRSKNTCYFQSTQREEAEEARVPSLALQKKNNAKIMLQTAYLLNIQKVNE